MKDGLWHMKDGLWHMKDDEGRFMAHAGWFMAPKIIDLNQENLEIFGDFHPKIVD